MEILKRDGSKQEFDAGKIRKSLEKAAVDSGEKLSEKTEKIDRIAKEIMESIQEQDKPRTADICDEILAKLDEADAKMAQAWREFDHKYKSLE